MDGPFLRGAVPLNGAGFVREAEHGVNPAPDTIRHAADGPSNSRADRPRGLVSDSGPCLRAAYDRLGLGCSRRSQNGQPGDSQQKMRFHHQLSLPL
jgi:hypothetical protein